MAKDVTATQADEAKPANPTEGTTVEQGAEPLNEEVKQAKPKKTIKLEDGTIRADY